MPIIQAIAQVERPQPQPIPQPQPQPIPRATVNVASVLAKLEESSSTLDLFSDGNIPPVEQNAGKVLHEELVIDWGVGIGRYCKFKPIYCQVYKLPATPSTPERKVLVVSPVPIVSNVAFGEYCDRKKSVGITQKRRLLGNSC
ncbi:hypothetical protein [Okeania sp. KiyG1]|uniref:hypothetical protein n=1 Tax=Okeania sp. KiyG1 TaxID=2720165 RepID=UPI001925093E|nr:hypothetical protein [Okeania sp. KiyG1]GGA56067.1 hypothetical protein CYANOKiyG1_76850 [Okeania sp. KiyG1]